MMYKMTEEHKQKIGLANSISQKGKKLSEETKKKISENHKCRKPDFIHPLKGKHHTKKWIKIMKEKMKGNTYAKGTFRSLEYKKKLSDYWKNNKPNHPNWKGGITPLYYLIRHLEENKNWRNTIFKRDNYTCQECGIKNGLGYTIKFEAHHHIKSFSSILKEFLQEYNQFSPIEDKETLARLAITYQSFWDISNGETLCMDCHNLTRNFIIRPQDIRKLGGDV